jgi:hypothetical protein
MNTKQALLFLLLMPSQSESWQHKQKHEDDNGDERCHHSSTIFLAEITKLLADSKPICARVAIVGQVDYGSGCSTSSSV